MPLILTSSSTPSIRDIGIADPLKVLSELQANRADIRPLRIGLMNNMTNESAMATERQFLRLIGAEPVLQVEPVIFTASGVPRNETMAEHIKRFYPPFSQIKEEGLDGLIISGANFGNGPIETLPFFSEITEVMDWAKVSVASTLTSCLATHVLMKHYHNIDRILNTKKGKSQKIWGVFDHAVTDPSHPLVSGMNTDIPVVHSRWNDIPREQFEKVGHQILMSSQIAGVHLATTRNFRFVMLQGHPEYDTVSIAREYLRDKQKKEPHEPIGYLSDELRSLDPSKKYTNEYIEQVGNLKNNWRDSAQVMMARWISLVFKLTNNDIHKQYMEGIDPEDPLSILRK